jgi:hypothetical protein
VGATAQLCTAYETLRDPVRRRAYDQSLDPKPETSPWGIAASQWSGGPYMMSAAASPAPPAAPRSRPERPAPFIAAPLREPVSAEPAPSRAQELLRRLEEQRRSAAPADREPEQARPTAPAYREPEQARAPEPKPDAELEQVIAEIRTVGRTERDSLHTADNRGFAWRRPAVAFGGLVVGVGALGAMAGLSVAGHEQAVRANAVSVPLPRAKPAAVADAPEPAPVADAQPEWRARPAVAARPRTPVAQRVVEDAPVETAAQPSFEEAAAAEAPTAAARMPLTAAVVSRTIERIGYPCGGVASAIPVEGSAGAFTVTCTSGHSFRAAPVRGRYHFRRLGSR